MGAAAEELEFQNKGMCQGSSFLISKRSVKSVKFSLTATLNIFLMMNLFLDCAKSRCLKYKIPSIFDRQSPSSVYNGGMQAP